MRNGRVEQLLAPKQQPRRRTQNSFALRSRENWRQNERERFATRNFCGRNYRTRNAALPFPERAHGEWVRALSATGREKWIEVGGAWEYVWRRRAVQVLEKWRREINVGMRTALIDDSVSVRVGGNSEGAGPFEWREASSLLFR